MTEIANVEIYGLEESCVASGYPMKTDAPKEIKCTTKDILRMTKLGSAPYGSGHDCALKGIVVQFDLRTAVKVWTEMERYHHVEFVSSQSSMQRLSKMDLDKCFNENTDERIVKILKELQTDYMVKVAASKVMNTQKSRDIAKEAYLKLLFSCPTGLELTARLSTNYLQLKTIYKQRKDHRLPDWHIICDWIESLPYVSEFGVVS